MRRYLQLALIVVTATSGTPAAPRAARRAARGTASAPVAPRWRERRSRLRSSRAVPSCSSGRRSRRPHSAGVLNSCGVAASCRMPSPVPTSCSSRSENSGTTLRLNTGFALGSGLQRRHVARRAADAGEERLARAHGVVDRPAPGRREELHERLEVVDAAPPRPAIRLILGIGNRVAQLHLLGRDAERELVRKQIVGDPHLVPVGVRRRTPAASRAAPSIRSVRRGAGRWRYR